MNFNTPEHKEVLSLLNASLSGIIFTTEDRKIMFVNAKCLTMLGIGSESEILNKPLSDLFQEPGEHHTQVIDQEKNADQSMMLMQKPDGSQVPVLLHSKNFRFGGVSLIMVSIMDITSTIRKTADLSESKRQFTTLLDNLPGMVYRCRNDRDWTMEFISDGCIELTGYKPSDLILNKTISYNDLIALDDRDRIWNEVQVGLKSHLPYTLNYKIITANHQIKWVWERAKGIFSQNGTLQHIEGFIFDVTEQKRAELIQKILFEISKSSYMTSNLDEVFRSIHANLGLILDVENFYVAMYDKKTHTISLPYQVDSEDKFAVFPAGKTMTGYIIQTRTPLMATQQIIEELARTGQIEIVGTPAKVWLGVPLIVNDEVIGVIAVQNYTDPNRYNLQDLELLKFVADQIAISILRKSVEDVFQKEKAYLDQLFEGSPEAIIMIDTDGNVIKANSEFTHLYGYRQNEIIGVNVDELIANPDIKSEAVQITQNVLKGSVTELETQRKHKDGHLIDVSIIVTPIIIKGVTEGAYGIYRDISDRKKIEKNLIAAKEKAEESDKLKSAFLSNMSHEIRTPMNAILGFSTLLSDPGISEEERTEFIHIIKERGTDLMRIIDDIIDVAKIESGQVRIEIKECKVNNLLTNLSVTLNEVKRKTNKLNVILNCLPGNTDKDFTILTDGNRLRQILTNLIENALKFTDEGFVEFGYTFLNVENKSFIEFFVRDTGIGIPQEMHNIIFERFRQVDDSNTRKYGGTGLGLTISKNLIQLLGGEIRLESERGKGTKFFVRLPLTIPPGMTFDAAIPKPAAVAPNTWPGKVILVAEDEESNFFLMDRILKRTGVKLVWAKNGFEAIEMCNSQHIDLVLMDIRMPLLDGYEATVEIKKEHKTLPIIAQTAYALKGERERSLAAGCDNYLSKPIDSRELLSILGKYLG
ncbi:MAG: PAS domain S-box protein [Alphaproteobacteria bacterium]|nr:PAS domain S-box protein [Alphaproteobacteria bacterium]